MSAPTIDVLLPFYGDPGLMKQAVISVLEQDVGGFRLIVIDDAYPDPLVAQWFDELNDSRVSYFRNETNLGANANYRLALDLASASHVVFMGADDIMLPNYIRTVRSILAQRPKATVVQPGVRTIDEYGRLANLLADRVKQFITPHDTGSVQLFAGESLATRLLVGNWTYFPSLCFNRSAIDEVGFRHNFHVVQDLALLIDLSIAGSELCYAAEPVFLYRRHAQSDSAVKGATGARFREEREFFRLAERLCRDIGWRKAARAAWLRPTSRMNSLTMLPQAMRGGRFDVARSLAAHTLGR